MGNRRQSQTTLVMTCILSACNYQHTQTPDKAINTMEANRYDIKAANDLVMVLDRYLTTDGSPQEFAVANGTNITHPLTNSLEFQLKSNPNITTKMGLSGEKHMQSDDIEFSIKESEKLSLVRLEAVFGKSEPDTPDPEGNPFVVRFPKYKKQDFNSTGRLYAYLNGDFDNPKAVVITLIAIKE